MKFIAMRELKINPSKVILGLRRGPVVVTRHGKPAAALIPLNEQSLDQFILLCHPTLLKEVERARSEYKRKGGIGLARMRRRLDRRHAK